MTAPLPVSPATVVEATKASSPVAAVVTTMRRLGTAGAPISADQVREWSDTLLQERYSQPPVRWEYRNKNDVGPGCWVTATSEHFYWSRATRTRSEQAGQSPGSGGKFPSTAMPGGHCATCPTRSSRCTRTPCRTGLERTRSWPGLAGIFTDFVTLSALKWLWQGCHCEEFSCWLVMLTTQPRKSSTPI